MQTTTVVISLLGLLVVVLGYTTINLLFKVEKQEDVMMSYRKFFEVLLNKVVESDKKLKDVDTRGVFQSDDEVGSVFSQIKAIHDSLSNFFKVDNL
jgi:hypothetical protein